MGSLDRLTEYLRARPNERVVLSYSDIEQIIGTLLPASARRHGPAFWSDHSVYAQAWKKAGYRAVRTGLPPEEVAFVREPELAARARAERGGQPAALTAYLRRSPLDWVVLSASEIEQIAGGRLAPWPSRPFRLWAAPLSPYTRASRAAGYDAQPARLARDTLVFVRRRPVARRPGGRQAPPDTPLLLLQAAVEPSDAALPAGDADRSELFRRRRAYAEATSRRWRILSSRYGLLDPDALVGPSDEPAAAADGADWSAWGRGVAEALAALTGRLDDQVVEVHADEALRDALAEPLGRAGAALRVPLEGRGVDEQLQWYAQQIAAARPRPADDPPPQPSARRGAAAPPGEERLEHPARPAAATPWAEPPAPSAAAPPWAEPQAPPAAAGRSQAPADQLPGRAPAVTAALLRFGQDLAAGDVEPYFTRDPEANALVLSDPFAYLVGVIAERGTDVEQEWALPHRLRQRLGHLDPARVAADPHGVRAALLRPPALHDQAEELAGQIVAAARQVVSRYGGDAGQLWAGAADDRELGARLDDLPGVGPAKSTAVTELLKRLLRTPLSAFESAGAPCDDHVRRVLLRSGLVERDDPAHVVAVMHAAYAGPPSALQYPAWEIGRRWCHPALPNCAACALGRDCAKLLQRTHDASDR